MKANLQKVFVKHSLIYKKIKRQFKNKPTVVKRHVQTLQLVSKKTFLSLLKPAVPI